MARCLGIERCSAAVTAWMAARSRSALASIAATWAVVKIGAGRRVAGLRWVLVDMSVLRMKKALGLLPLDPARPTIAGSRRRPRALKNRPPVCRRQLLSSAEQVRQCGLYLTLSQYDSLRGLILAATIRAMSDRHQIAPYPVRLPPELRAHLEAAAKAGGRSLHAEIIGRLAGTLADEARRDIAQYDLILKDSLIWDLLLEVIYLRGDFLMLAMLIDRLEHHTRKDVLPERYRELAEHARESAGRMRIDLTRPMHGLSDEHKRVLRDGMQSIRDGVRRRAKAFRVSEEDAVREVDTAFRGMSVFEEEQEKVAGTSVASDPVTPRKRMTMRRQLKD